MCGKTPNLAVVYRKDTGREVCAAYFTFDQNKTISDRNMHAKHAVRHYQTNTDSFVLPLNMLSAVNPEDNALENMMNFVILCKMFYSQTKIYKITT